jgi:lipopolysaccharide transport system ATP-binding protein
LSAIQNLCMTGLFLKNGQVVEYGKVEKVMKTYINSSQQNYSQYSRRWGNKKAEFLEYKLCDDTGAERVEFFMGDAIYFHLKVRFNEKIRHADIGINIKNNVADLITHVANFDDEFLITANQNEIQEFKVELTDVFFSPNLYTVDVAIVSGRDHFDMIEDVFTFSFIEGNKIKRGSFPSHVKIFTKSKWQRI